MRLTPLPPNYNATWPVRLHSQDPDIDQAVAFAVSGMVQKERKFRCTPRVILKFVKLARLEGAKGRL